MTITIGGFTCQTLTAQPFGYEGEARTGLTARTFQISGLLTPAQWQSLVSVYNTWRDTRITDADTLSSASVGTTVALTINANGLSVTALACWFADAPSGEQAGAYINASLTLVITCPSRVEAAIATAASSRIASNTNATAIISCGFHSVVGF